MVINSNGCEKLRHNLREVVIPQSVFHFPAILPVLYQSAIREPGPASFVKAPCSKETWSTGKRPS